MSKVDWSQKNMGKLTRDRQEKMVAQTRVIIMEKKEKWIEGGINKTW